NERPQALDRALDVERVEHAHLLDGDCGAGGVTGSRGGGGRIVIAAEQLEQESDQDDAQEETADGDDGAHAGGGLDGGSGRGRERTLGEAGAALLAVPVAGGVLGPTGWADRRRAAAARRRRGRLRAELELFVFVVACAFLVVSEKDSAGRAELFLPGYGGTAFRANMSCHFAPSTSAERDGISDRRSVRYCATSCFFRRSSPPSRGHSDRSPWRSSFWGPWSPWRCGW